MATINSTIRMHDKSTATFDNIINSLDKVIYKAEALDSMSIADGLGVEKITPALQKAVSQYNKLVQEQDLINDKIELLKQKENILYSQIEKEKNSRRQNEAIINRMNIALNNTSQLKNNLINKSDQINQKVLKQAQLIDQVSNNTGQIEPQQNKIAQGFNNWQAQIVTINNLIQLTRSIFGAIRKVMDYTDTMTNTSARLNLINDGLQTQAELENKVYQAAENSRSSYEDTAATVAKLNLLAQDQFTGNDEAIKFTELIGKTFKIAGASATESSSAMYQLTQAMAAGKLQGDEFRSIMENAPMVATAIADYMKVPKGELKTLASEGEITADIIKAAVFNAGDDIESKFEQMPKTFATAMTSMRNNFNRAMNPIFKRITAFLNSETFDNFFNKVLNGLYIVAGGTIVFLNTLKDVWNFMQPFLPFIGAIIGAIVLYNIAVGIAAALTGAYSTVLGIFAGAQMLFTGATLEATAAQWGLNTAMVANPIGLVVAAIGTLILALAYLWFTNDKVAQAMLAGWDSMQIGAMTFGLGLKGIFNSIMAFLDTFVTGSLAIVDSFINGLLGMVNGFIYLLNKIPGVTIDALTYSTKSLDYAVGANERNAERAADLQQSADDIWNKASELNATRDQRVADRNNWMTDITTKLTQLTGSNGAISGSDYGNIGDYIGAGNEIGDIGQIKDEVNISDEDLKLLKDIATRDYMLNYKHITPNVNIAFGDVKETADVNAVADRLKAMMEEELAELYVVEEG